MPPRKRTAKKAGAVTKPARKTRKQAAAEEEAALANDSKPEAKKETKDKSKDEDVAQENEKAIESNEIVEINLNAQKEDDGKETNDNDSKEKEEELHENKNQTEQAVNTEESIDEQVVGEELSEMSKEASEKTPEISKESPEKSLEKFSDATVEESTERRPPKQPLVSNGQTQTETPKVSQLADTSMAVDKNSAIDNQEVPQYANDSDAEMSMEEPQQTATVLDNLGVPNHALYINNLNDKIQKEDLKRSLYFLFSSYGRILDIVAVKSPKMRGQAHVVFADIANATLALRALQGFQFFGKPMRISYAKSKSYAIAQLDGTFRIPEAAPLKESRLPLASFEQPEYDV